MSEKTYLMGIDIGTSESKGCIMDTHGKLVVFSSEKHGMENPLPNYYEHDADQVWWHDLCVLTRRLLQESGISKEAIQGLGISTLGTCCLPVDKDLKPLRKAILYGIDARSQKEIEYLTDYYGPEKVKALFGRPICSGDVCAKILWICNNEPDVYEKTYKFLTGTSYLVAKLTGNCVIDRFLGVASFRPFYDMEGNIQEEQCHLFCRPDQLPQAKVVSDIAGYVTAAAAEATGLAVGTPVVVGSGDSTAEAISTGVIHPGDVMVQFGSSIFIYCCTKHLIHDDRVRGNSFTIPNTFSVAAGTNNCGTAIDWYKNNFFPEAVAAQECGRENAYTAMMRAAASVPIGSGGLVTLPYFAGERTPINDPNAKGLVIGLTSHHTKNHLYRSALEGIAFSVAQHIDILKEHCISPLRLLAVGGGTKNELLMQMVADITGESVHIPEITIGASYGDALIAGIGVGVFQDFMDLQRLIRLTRTISPDSESHKSYQRYRNLYDQAYLATKDLMHQL